MASGFVWGQFDCATLFADSVRAITGMDPIADYRTYNSQMGALRLLAKEGSDSMQTFVSLRFAEINLAQLQCGDLAFVDGGGPLTCPCIVLDATLLGMHEEVGALALPRALAVRGFKVP